MTTTIYLSSTYEDLREHRRIVFEALRKAGYEVQWLRLAISRGTFSSYSEGEFPRYVWYKEGTVVYEGRLVNRTAGTYTR